MEPFRIHAGLVAPMDRENVDTDAIIPKQFLKSIKRSGFGPNLFDEWRYLDHGEPGQDPASRRPNPDFVLNQPRYQGASILLARKNFGCGSSREHAPWALQQFGFRALIAPSYADIFFNNCFKNGLLPIVLPEHAGRQAVRRRRRLRRLSPDDRPRAPGRRQARRRRARLRGRAVSQVLPARRLRRHRPDPAPRRQDPRLRGRAAAEAAVARGDGEVMARDSAASAGGR